VSREKLRAGRRAGAGAGASGGGASCAGGAGGSGAAPAWPVLNWRELAALIAVIARELDEPGAHGMHLDRVVVPERKRFPAGFLKSEWALRLVGRKREVTLVFSVRARRPYLMMCADKGPRAAESGSRSVFDLSLGKYLKGAKFLGVEAFDRERACVLWFRSGDERLGLVLWMVPATPEALLVRGGPAALAAPGGDGGGGTAGVGNSGGGVVFAGAADSASGVNAAGGPDSGGGVNAAGGPDSGGGVISKGPADSGGGVKSAGRPHSNGGVNSANPPASASRAASPESPHSGMSFEILARSRTTAAAAAAAHSAGGAADSPQRFHLPDGSRAPTDLAIREELVASAEAYRNAVERALDAEAFELRWQALEKSLRHALKHARERRRQSEVAANEAEAEPDWQRFGVLLKSSLHEVPPIDADGARELTDFATGQSVRVPCDRKLTPQAQVEKFFHMARRKASRRSQALSRVEAFDQTIARLEAALGSPPSAQNWPELEKLERAAGLGAEAAPSTHDRKRERASTGSGWLGRTFISHDGWRIWVGKSRDENLELTFKHARGNDLWMHVRGKPGAHVVIPVPSGKSVPLETLLDAAALCVFYSGGQNWGKTEVDYTFKKHVKRIRDSTEASYTHNKTLIVAPEPARLKRLLDAAD
jgi:hypothetical protein